MKWKHEDDYFRCTEPELTTGPGGKLVWLTICEERESKHGRWEPFVSIKPLHSRRPRKSRPQPLPADA